MSVIKLIKNKILQNLTLAQIDEVIAAYGPANISNVTATKIAISNMLGDLMFVCPSEEFALVLIMLYYKSLFISFVYLDITAFTTVCHVLYYG